MPTGPPLVCLCALLAAHCCGTGLFAGQWPQILGPKRNGHAVDERLADSWPDGGLATVWQRSVGSGFAGIAVSDGVAVLFHRIDDEERVEAMDARGGEVLWSAAFATDYRPSVVSDDGPRCVPLIHDGRVYVFGVQGGLRCLELAGGREIWSRETQRDYGAPEGYFGAGSSPIIEGDRLLAGVGAARHGAGIVAFSAKTGKTLWKATEEQPSYSSPVAATIDGRRHLIFVTRLNAVSVDPATGRVRFQIPFGRRGPTVNAANPLVFDRHLFLSASYGVGAVLARIENNGAEILWQSDDVLSSQYTTGIYHDGHLFGVHGRQDVGVAVLRCVDPATREIRWTQRDFGYATLIKADGKLLIMQTDGELALAELNSREYRELARARLLPGTTRALPALSDGLFYVRNERTLKCVRLPGRP